MAIVSHNSARLLELLYAVPALGGAFWCRSTSGSRPRRSLYIAEHSGARVLLVDPEVRPVVVVDYGRPQIPAPVRKATTGLPRFDLEPQSWPQTLTKTQLRP